MSKVDWSLAPEWAQCVICAYDDKSESFKYWAEAWGSEGNRCLLGRETIPLRDFDRASTRRPHAWTLIEERPKPATWSGPQDGLPPVGTVCELRTKSGGWGDAEIKYQGRRGICVWLWVRRDGNCEQVEWAESPDKLEFRAIKTPKQLAADIRETAIVDMAKVLPGASYECYSFNDDGSVKPYQRVRMILELLVDAGFKREVV